MRGRIRREGDHSRRARDSYVQLRARARARQDAAAGLRLVEGSALELMSGAILSSSKQLHSDPEEAQPDGLNVDRLGVES
eukprot:530374-Rhodomonas_salina.1